PAARLGRDVLQQAAGGPDPHGSGSTVVRLCRVPVPQHRRGAEQGLGGRAARLAGHRGQRSLGLQPRGEYAPQRADRSRRRGAVRYPQPVRRGHAARRVLRLPDPYELWLDDSGQPIKSQGNEFDFYAQNVYPGWDAPLILASGLEARYIAAEAALKNGDPGPAEALIAERSNPDAESGDDIDFVEDTGTLVQLLDEKARDLFLRGTHLGDWRRNPDSTPYVPPAGSPYYAVQFGAAFGPVTCMPTPQQEVDNNPNFGN